MLAIMDRRLIWFLGLMVPVLGRSWVDPHDRFTRCLEVVPALIGVPLILAVRRTFPLSTLLLRLIWTRRWAWGSSGRTARSV
jgi:putative membrane protein